MYCIKLKSKNNKKKISIILFVLVLSLAFLSLKVFAAQPFNVEIDLPDNYQNVNPGSEIWFTINLLNLANSQRIDVTLNYEIIDLDNKSVIHNSKTVAIETQASFVASLRVPENLPSGKYYINVMVSSSLGESSSKSSLLVSNSKKDFIYYYISLGAIVILLIIFLIIKSKSLIEKIRLKIKIRKIVRDKLKK